MLQEMLSLNIWAFFLILARVGGALALLPALSAGYVSVRSRLALAAGLSLILVPVLAYKLPIMPFTVPEMAVLMATESIIGMFYGGLARVMLAALQAAGSFIALFSSLSNALIQDPLAEQQSSIVAGFLTTMGFVMIFATEIDHVMLRALVETYDLFEPGEPLPWGDFANHYARTVADSFELGLRMAAPLALTGLTYYIGLGIMGRLMPALPVFFFGLPVQITVQIMVFSIALSAIMMVAMRHLETGLLRFGGS